jgi:hypothetical protein
VSLDEPRYIYYTFRKNPAVVLAGAPIWVTGLFSLRHTNDQAPPEEWGIPGFEIWTPPRRPDGHLIVLRSETKLTEPFGPDQVANGYSRPAQWPNAWVAAPDDLEPSITLNWDKPKRVKRIELVFDTDYNHPMESVIRGHPESVMPMCVRDYSLHDAHGAMLYATEGNYQSMNLIELRDTVVTDTIELRVHKMNGAAPAALLDFRVYEE